MCIDMFIYKNTLGFNLRINLKISLLIIKIKTFIILI